MKKTDNMKYLIKIFKRKKKIAQLRGLLEQFFLVSGVYCSEKKHTCDGLIVTEFRLRIASHQARLLLSSLEETMKNSAHAEKETASLLKEMGVRVEQDFLEGKLDQLFDENVCTLQQRFVSRIGVMLHDFIALCILYPAEGEREFSTDIFLESIVLEDNLCLSFESVVKECIKDVEHLFGTIHSK